MKKLLALAAVGIAATGLTGCFSSGDIKELEDFFTLMESGDFAQNSTMSVSMDLFGFSMSSELAIDGDKIKSTLTVPDDITGEDVTIVAYQELRDDKYYNYFENEGVWYVMEITDEQAVDLSSELVFDLEGVKASDFTYSNNRWVITETEEGVEMSIAITFYDDGSVKISTDMMGMEIMSTTFSNVGTTVVTLPTDAVDLDTLN